MDNSILIAAVIVVVIALVAGYYYHMHHSDDDSVDVGVAVPAANAAAACKAVGASCNGYGAVNGVSKIFVRKS
jgi:hypothetical protein